MERDIRRDRGQWRGCYSFKDIICDGDSGSIPRRNGGLKMGHTYYYYYELDGASETHDPSLPSTNTCPYLPGQTVNSLWVPMEQSNRKRSASVNSMRDENFKTMNPADKYISPRAAPVPPESQTTHRVGTAPLRLQHKRSARSISPSSGWSFSPRKLFSRKASSSSLKDGQSPPSADDTRSVRSSDGSRSRDISPESLRRFLSDNVPVEEVQQSNDWPIVAIPEDIVEENEDDDNFATSAVSESMQFTGLSPPPSQRSFSPSPPPSTILSPPSLAPINRPDVRLAPAPPTRPPPAAPRRSQGLRVPSVQTKQPTLSLSEMSFYSPASPQSPDSGSLPAFYHSEGEEDEEPEVLSAGDEEGGPRSIVRKNLDATLSTYSLPKSSVLHEDKQPLVPNLREEQQGSRSPAMVAADNNVSIVVGSPAVASLLGNHHVPSSAGMMDDLLTELGWMADVIHGSHRSTSGVNKGASSSSRTATPAVGMI